MNLPSTSKSNVDPDYVLIESEQTTNLNSQDFDEWLSKVNTVINREFKLELDRREKQIQLIQNRTTKTSKMLHLLRYVLVNSYFNNAETVLQEDEEETYRLQNNQSRVHPAIKKLLGPNKHLNILNKKRQKVQKPGTCNVKQESNELSLRVVCDNDSDINHQVHNNGENKEFRLNESNENCQQITNSQRCLKNYNKESLNAASIIRNRVLTKHIIIIGNISKYIPSKNPNDKLVHKWMVYVRGPKDKPDITGFAHKVVFYLHPSYKPNDIIEVEEYPFHLTRRGWGEFPLRVKIYFKNNYNKPVDIIHNLRLDKTYVGRQTLGSETVVRVNLYDATETSNYFENDEIIENEERVEDVDISEDIISRNKRIKVEIDDSSNDSLDHSLMDEQLDTSSFFVNKTEYIEQNVKQESSDGLFFQHSSDQFNNTSIIPDDFDFNLLKLQQSVDVDHSYSKYTISSGIKRKQTEIPFYDCKRIKTDNHFPGNEHSDSSHYIKIYDMNRLRSAVQMITFLLRKMPLVTDLAHKSNYKSVFPYSARNLYEYRSWNIPKRQASEWSRARIIRNAIISSELPNCTNWSTRKIVLFARAYGFTPFSNFKPFNKIIYQQHLKDVVAASRPKIESPHKSDNLQVDITNNYPSNLNMNGFCKSKVFVVNPLTEKYNGFVKEGAFEMGAILREDEIIPGVFHNTAETLLLKAAMCFAEDLLRCSRADAVYKGQFRESEGFVLRENVVNALNTYREEFTHVTSFNKYTKLF